MTYDELAATYLVAGSPVVDAPVLPQSPARRLRDALGSRLHQVIVTCSAISERLLAAGWFPAGSAQARGGMRR